MNYFQQYYLFCFLIVAFLISVTVLFGSNDEDGNINKSETDKEVKLEKKRKRNNKY